MVGSDVSAPPPVSVLFDMGKVWRFNRGKFLYGIAMSIKLCRAWHDQMGCDASENGERGHHAPITGHGIHHPLGGAARIGEGGWRRELLGASDRDKLCQSTNLQVAARPATSTKLTARGDQARAAAMLG